VGSGMNETIFALSSGAPPAAIAVFRISGPGAKNSLFSLVGKDLAPRRATLASLKASGGGLLDQALVVWFPGPNTATGEDLVELHCHGGRAVIAAVEAELEKHEGCRKAEPGEFTRRAFVNGRIDLSQAEGLAELLRAETEIQRVSAVAMSGGTLSREVEGWREILLVVSAEIEAVLDFGDEEDVPESDIDLSDQLSELLLTLEAWLSRPRSERIGEGLRVLFLGPPNTGKSSLFNAIIESEAAITSPSAGTTRDTLERSVAIDGIPFTFIDTAGLHEAAVDTIELEGIERARREIEKADLVLWLGPEHEGPSGCWEIESQVDIKTDLVKNETAWRVSAATGDGLFALKAALVDWARDVLPKPGEAVLTARQHARLKEVYAALSEAPTKKDPLIVAECLRRARASMDQLLGKTTTEDMLDALFGQFCIGK
jgi:tRNA modification GTPase